MSNTALAAQPVRVAAPLRPWYLLAAAAAFTLMIAAILGPSLWFLNFVHVMTGVLWTGIDLFMSYPMFTKTHSRVSACRAVAKIRGQRGA